ncbi:TetR/AcrR family transcriptional regulator [Reichenbachiella versicolor]|uniref:TetR/AcrR family transcriptional regulator n=1 Tax=Reichenbachiella versicolor TaxID=1821036 RepID=UPI001FE78F64|nr:TetR/AcrR family transcriptional regulator [Reichenbachiella versicolor]
MKDPQETELGKKIIKESVTMIDELGFEGFTFKKLAAKIDSTEASIYRYFENKHRLLVYVIAWYWNWLEYKIDFGTHNIENPVDRLKVALKIITEKKEPDPLFPQVMEDALHRIVISESNKTFLTKTVDEDNRDGLFRGFKSLCEKVASIVTEIDASFKYPHSLISTVMQAAHQQVFYAEHIPTLTDLNQEEMNIYQKNEDFLQNVVFNCIKTS